MIAEKQKITSKISSYRGACSRAASENPHITVSLPCTRRTAKSVVPAVYHHEASLAIEWWFRPSLFTVLARSVCVCAGALARMSRLDAVSCCPRLALSPRQHRTNMEVPALHMLQEVDSYFPANPQPTTLPVRNPTRSFWLNSSDDCNPLADHGRDAPLPAPTVDIAIIGTGISGVSTLFHLIQEFRRTNRAVTRIVLLEARQFSSGASARNGGMCERLRVLSIRLTRSLPTGHCTAYNPVEFKTLANAFGVAEAKKHVALERRAVEAILALVEKRGWADAVDLVRGGNIHLINSRAERTALEEQLAAARQAGVDTQDFRFLDEQECARLIHSGKGISGLRIPGNNLYPLKLITKMFNLACEQAAEIGIDVQLFTHTPVNNVTKAASASTSADPWLLSTSRGEIRAKQVVHATNGYVSHLLPEFATGRQKVVPCRGQVVAVRPAQEGVPPFWTTGFCQSRPRPRQDDLVASR